MILQIAFLLTWAPHASFLAIQAPLEEVKSVSVAFCDLVRAPEEYHGKTIRTRAILVVGPESMELYVPGCSTEETSTWLDWKGYEQAYTIATKKTKGALKRFLNGDRRAWVDVVGRFYGKPQEARVPENAPSEVKEILRRAQFGYGHMNMYRFQVLPTRFQDASKVEKNVKWPKQD